MSFTVKRWLTVALTAILVIAALLFRDFFFHSAVGLSVFAGGFIVVFVLNLLWWECPHCHQMLGRMSLFAEYCPFCGKKFEE